MAKRARKQKCLMVKPFFAVACFAYLAAPAAAQTAIGQAERSAAAQIIDASGVKGGFIVHLGCGDGKLTAALRTGKSYQVHGLDTDVDDVRRARKHIQSLGIYGDVSVDQLSSNRLPYIDNLINLVVSEDLSGLAMDEVLRVLVPNGVAYLKQGETWRKTVKPRPDNIDEWTHYMHDATGNAVAHDDVVGPPRRLQWIGSPRWSRHHDRMASASALVSAGGRMIYVMDEGSRVSIQLPPKWTLIARDAFNGTILWKREIPTWHSHLWPLKSGPTQLARRLVATGDRVYVTLGLEAPLTALDAETGETIRTYEDSKSTEELIFSDGVLFLLVNKGPSELTSYAPLHNVGDQRRVSQQFHWNEMPRRIMAVDAESGQELWSKPTKVAPLTLASDGRRVFFHDGEKVVCLDRRTGLEIWTTPPVSRRPRVTMNFGPKLVIYQNVLLFAGGDRTMKAFSVESGRELWTAPHAQSGYLSPEDVLVAGGLVWNAPTTRTQDSGVFTGRDPLTGEVKSQFPPDVKTYWFHHRCYMAKATDKFLLPSRTGIEFVDYQSQHWDINHWVRGGCLYGIMPCNGLVYAPPHNCACYPEAKLYGLNALAPAGDTNLAYNPLTGDLSVNSGSEQIPDDRLQRGPAYNDDISADAINPEHVSDWPTYRGDAARSGFTRAAVSTDVSKAWESQLGGRLSSVVVAGGKLYVAQVDAHTVHALDAESGAKRWSHTAGGRVDSPPTVHQGRVLFGSADGWVYCLRAADGELVWRFRGAPRDQRLMSLEQLESVWPIHGSVLVVPDGDRDADPVVCFVAGRSTFLDGGMWWFKLDLKTGNKLAEVNLDNRDPETGDNLQARLQILNMPVGLPDVLSSDGRYCYMRSQRFDMHGKRYDLGPHSGQPAEQGSTQQGDGAHLFAPMGFLDDTYFHRAYWVYGRSFAGGHAGYYQAGKYAPSGRLLVHDDSNVYGFTRKPQYYKWTTILEHQLLSTSKNPPIVDQKVVRRGGVTSVIRFEKTESLDPTGKPLAVEAWVNAERPDGVVLARGGPTHGYALLLRGGKPRFVVRVSGEIFSAAANVDVVGKWAHLVGTLTAEKQLQLYVDGQLVSTGKASGLIASDPAQAMEIGADDRGAVGNYNSPLGFSGLIDQVKVYHGSLSAAEIKARYEQPHPEDAQNATLVLSCSFDDGDGRDESGYKHHGEVVGARATRGKWGNALRFVGRAGRGGGSFVVHNWKQDVPLLVRAMVLAGKTLFIAGPPDVMDEEETFQRLTARDPAIHATLARQEAALQGDQGAIFWAVSAETGRKLAQYSLESLPVWDGMAAANGRVYLATTEGTVCSYAEASAN